MLTPYEIQLIIMPPKEFFVQVYYDGHVQRTDTEGVVFSCNNSSLFKVKKNIKLDGLIQCIQTKIQPDNSKRVVDLVYRYPTTLAQGLVWYESLNLVGDDDVQMMFDMFMTCKPLGISTMEVYAGLVDAPCDETHVVKVRKTTRRGVELCFWKLLLLRSR